MNQYIVTTPLNPTYGGKTCGVRFERGRAFVSEYTINPALGYDVDEVARRMKVDFGYEVTKVEEEAAVAVETIYAKIPDSAPVNEAPTGGAKKTRGGK